MNSQVNLAKPTNASLIMNEQLKWECSRSKEASRQARLISIFSNRSQQGYAVLIYNHPLLKHSLRKNAYVIAVFHRLDNVFTECFAQKNEDLKTRAMWDLLLKYLIMAIYSGLKIHYQSNEHLTTRTMRTYLMHWVNGVKQWRVLSFHVSDKCTNSLSVAYVHKDWLDTRQISSQNCSSFVLQMLPNHQVKTALQFEER